MADFQRARSEEQKSQRMAEVKAAAARQFAARPYHEITLTTIADELSWSRANLYKYVTTKEDVFLELAADARDAYYGALLAAFPAGCGFGRETVAEVWAGIMCAHADWFRLHDLLFTIIEANVAHERLVAFKRGYYGQIGLLRERFASVAGIAPEQFETFMNALTYHAAGLVTYRCDTPQIAAALAELGVNPTPPDFRAEMREFIAMCLGHWSKETEG